MVRRAATATTTPPRETEHTEGKSVWGHKETIVEKEMREFERRRMGRRWAALELCGRILRCRLGVEKREESAQIVSGRSAQGRGDSVQAWLPFAMLLFRPSAGPLKVADYDHPISVFPSTFARGGRAVLAVPERSRADNATEA